MPLACAGGCKPGACEQGCCLKILSDLLGAGAIQDGGKCDQLLDLHSCLRRRVDAEESLRLFCELRSWLEDENYLAFYRLRQWLQKHIFAEFEFTERQGSPGSRQLPLRLVGRGLPAVRRGVLCDALRQGLSTGPRAMRFQFVPLPGGNPSRLNLPGVQTPGAV